MALPNAAQALATVLEAAGLGLARPPAADANLFTAPMPEADGVPDVCVALVNTGGGPPDAYVAGTTRAAYYHPSVQVRVRSSPEDFEGGETLARQALEALNLSSPAGFVLCRVDQSAPTYFGPDQGGRHRWSFNVELGLSA